ncbi:MAG: outer membrane protein assembly factor BamB [Flavobacteriaceae bacterium]|jgi:outer membrane protein assembly factor BamB
MKIFALLLLICAFNLNAQHSRWSVKIDSADIFSSPRFIDLNQDGVKDVVIGGGIEDKTVSHGVIALNGLNGQELWYVPAYTQIYTSALFQDIDEDGVSDVFIGGRAASFFAISGATGKVIWKFWDGTAEGSRKAGHLNFFSTQWLADQNDDGYRDLLVTNGGDYLASPSDNTRPTAKLMVLSGLDGTIISSARMPENRESYYAPHIHNNKKKPMIVFGTGGETIDGKLWQVPLKSIVKGNMKKAKVITADSVKGFILNSVMADLNSDGKQDFINIRMNGAITAIDACKRKVLWEKSFPGYECYVTPSLGQFVGDSISDVFTILAKGSFPQYTAFKLIVIDGGTGEISWQEDSGFNQFSPGISVDMDSDGIDEIIYIENTLKDPETYTITNRVKVINLIKKESYYLGSEREGLSMASSPGFVDLEEDGTPEIVVATSSLNMGQGAQFSIIECIELPKTIKTATWPGYLGPQENGSLK